MGRTLVRIVSLTLALGATVVVSWLTVRGVSVFTGPGPFLDGSWWVVWAIQVGLAGIVGLIVGRTWGRDSSAGWLTALLLAAWVGELLVVALLTPILSDDLRLFHALWVWLVATAGPVQPLAAIVGALVGRERARSVTHEPAG
jgi:hypothetical protein